MLGSISSCLSENSDVFTFYLNNQVCYKLKQEDTVICRINRKSNIYIHYYKQFKSQFYPTL